MADHELHRLVRDLERTPGDLHAWTRLRRMADRLDGLPALVPVDQVPLWLRLARHLPDAGVVDLLVLPALDLRVRTGLPRAARIRRLLDHGWQESDGIWRHGPTGVPAWVESRRTGEDLCWVPLGEERETGKGPVENLEIRFGEGEIARFEPGEEDPSAPTVARPRWIVPSPHRTPPTPWDWAGAWVSRFPATVQAYARVVEQCSEARPRAWTRQQEKAMCPLVGVDRTQAEHLCRAAGGMLLHEVVRSVILSTVPSDPPDQRGLLLRHQADDPRPAWYRFLPEVGETPNWADEHGIEDLVGVVWEWSPPSETHRHACARGGGWSVPWDDLGPHAHWEVFETAQRPDLGFRLMVPFPKPAPALDDSTLAAAIRRLEAAPEAGGAREAGGLPPVRIPPEIGPIPVEVQALSWNRLECLLVSPLDGRPDGGTPVSGDTRAEGPSSTSGVGFRGVISLDTGQDRLVLEAGARQGSELPNLLASLGDRGSLGICIPFPVRATAFHPTRGRLALVGPDRLLVLELASWRVLLDKAWEVSDGSPPSAWSVAYPPGGRQVVVCRGPGAPLLAFSLETGLPVRPWFATWEALPGLVGELRGDASGECRIRADDPVSGPRGWFAYRGGQLVPVTDPGPRSAGPQDPCLGPRRETRLVLWGRIPEQEPGPPRRFVRHQTSSHVLQTENEPPLLVPSARTGRMFRLVATGTGQVDLSILGPDQSIWRSAGTLEVSGRVIDILDDAAAPHLLTLATTEQLTRIDLETRDTVNADYLSQTILWRKVPRAIAPAAGGDVLAIGWGGDLVALPPVREEMRDLFRFRWQRRLRNCWRSFPDPHGGRIRLASFSPDGERVAVVLDPSETRVLKITTLDRFPGPRPAPGPVVQIHLLDDCLVSLTAGGVLHRAPLSLDEDDATLTIDPHGVVVRMAASPDGRHFALVGSDGAVSVVDALRFVIVEKFRPAGLPADAIAFAPDGRSVWVLQPRSPPQKIELALPDAGQQRVAA